MHLLAGSAAPEPPRLAAVAARPRALFRMVVIVRVCTVEDYTLANITGPARSETDRARVVIAVADDGEVKVLKDNLGDCVRVIG